MGQRVDALDPFRDDAGVLLPHVDRLEAAEPVVVGPQLRLVVAPRRFLGAVDRSSDGPSCCSRLTSCITRSVIVSMFSGAAPKLTWMWPPPRCGSGCDRPTETRVGLAELLAQDVAQRGLEHVVAAMMRSCSIGSIGRIGEEADHGLAARLASLLDLRALRCAVGKVDADVLEARTVGCARSTAAIRRTAPAAAATSSTLNAPTMKNVKSAAFANRSR